MLIRDREDINRAVDGDQVIIEIYPKSAWKAESEYLVPNNAEEKVEEKVEKSDDDASSHVLSRSRDCHCQTLLEDLLWLHRADSRGERARLRNA